MQCNHKDGYEIGSQKYNLTCPHKMCLLKCISHKIIFQNQVVLENLDNKF